MKNRYLKLQPRHREDPIYIQVSRENGADWRARRWIYLWEDELEASRYTQYFDKHLGTYVEITKDQFEVLWTLAQKTT